MGSYLSQPVTEKISVDESNDKLTYGASSMQGWRISQEDAHNSILDYDDGVSFFAVYDGHGGHEVAHYCAQKLPDFIKQTEAYKKGDIEQALIDGFLGFDASISKADVIAVLKEIAGEKEAEEDSDDEENVHNLYEEASMPIEKVIEKYTSLVCPSMKVAALKNRDKLPKSPMITSKKDSSVASASSSSSSEAAGSSKDSQIESSSSTTETEGGASSTSNNEVVSSSTTGEVNGDSKKEGIEDPVASNGSIPEIKVSDADSSDSKETKSEGDKEKNEIVTHNGDIASENEAEEKKDNVSSSVDEEVVSNKAKGKSPMKKITKTPIKTRPKRTSTQLYKNLLNFQGESEEEDTEDEEDKTFVGPGDDSSDDEGVNVSVEEAEGSEEESTDAEEGEEEEDDEDMEDEELNEFTKNMKEEPGSDSGCTAVVALLKGRELYVANAGDSRCIVCRNGKAVDMSFDHKPEDEPERARIVKAGGKVTTDGRVNGGLNLSRAIGDHAYKQNKELSDREQMITALPDVKKLTINPSEDEFMVLACDGIWNFMTSQEVVDFVKPRLEKNADKLSHICEEIFDHCLAPNTMGDGTGCDNMTAIIVKFQSNLKKRSFSPESTNPKNASSDPKRAKTEEGQSSETSS